MDADGNRVNVGNFDSNGLNVNNYLDDNRNDNLGVASARKFPKSYEKNALLFWESISFVSL